jgi:hypothetical protein
VDFFNQISIMYSILGEFCTVESCPIMSAGPRYALHWSTQLQQITTTTTTTTNNNKS